MISNVFFEEPDDYFEKVILQLEKISGRNLISRNLLLILNSEKKGVQGIIVVGKKEYTQKVETLKIAKTYTAKEVFELLLEAFKPLKGDFYLIEIGFSNLYYGRTGAEYGLRVVDKEVKESLITLLSDPLTLERVSFSLPFEIDLKELGNYVANKMIYPQVLPSNNRDLTIEQTVIKEIVNRDKSTFYDHQEDQNKIILGGSWLKTAVSLEQVTLTVIDGLELKGISYLYFDRYDLLKDLAPVFFNLAEEEKKAILTQLISHYVTVVIIIGPILYGRSLGKVTFDQDLEEKQEISLVGGEIYSLPLKNKVKLQFELDCLYGIFDSQLTKETREDKVFEVAITGGTNGVIIDCRGRPITISRGREGKKQIISWNQSLDTYYQTQKV